MVDPLAIITCRPVTCCGATNCPKRFSCCPFLSVFLYSRHLLLFASFFFFFFFFIFFFIFFCVFFLNDFPCLFLFFFGREGARVLPTRSAHSRPSATRFSWLNVFQIWLNRFRGGEKNRSARQTLITRDVRNFSFRYFSENCLKKRSTSIFPSEELDSFISVFSFCKKNGLQEKKTWIFLLHLESKSLVSFPKLLLLLLHGAWKSEPWNLELGGRFFF